MILTLSQVWGICTFLLAPPWGVAYERNPRRSPAQNKREKTTKRAENALGNVRNTYSVTDTLGTHWEEIHQENLARHGECIAKRTGLGVCIKNSSGNTQVAHPGMNGVTVEQIEPCTHSECTGNYEGNPLGIDGGTQEAAHKRTNGNKWLERRGTQGK